MVEKFHCETCGGNLQDEICVKCDKPGIFVKGDRVVVTELGLRSTEVESKQFLPTQILVVDRMGNSNGDRQPYVKFDNCPVCTTYNITCRGHWTGTQNPKTKFCDGAPTFKKVM